MLDLKRFDPSTSQLTTEDEAASRCRSPGLAALTEDQRAQIASGNFVAGRDALIAAAMSPAGAGSIKSAFSSIGRRPSYPDQAQAIAEHAAKQRAEKLADDDRTERLITAIDALTAELKCRKQD